MSLASKVVGNIKKSKASKASNNRQMESLAVEFYKLNVAANEAKRAAEKAREALFNEMKANGVEQFNVQDELLSLEAKITVPNKNVIDVESLAEIVAPATFIKIVSATQKSVVEHAGSDVATRCMRVEKGEENVSVKPVK